MATIRLQVIDLSHYETVQDYAKVKADGIVGVIWKATQGSNYQDGTYWKERTRALQAGLLWGSYHFGDMSTVEDQVHNYLAYAKPRPEELICLDYERNKANTMTLLQARAWVEDVEKELDRPGQVVIYSGDLIKERLGDKKDEFWGARRLWLAQYGSTPKVQASWDTYWLWQYTDGDSGPEPHEVHGISGGIDCSSYEGDPDQLRKEWSGGGTPLPVPEPGVPEVKILAPAGVKITVVQPEA